MTHKPGIVVTGASGRMGQMLIQTVLDSDKATLVGCVEREGHNWVGRDVGEAMGGAPVGVTVTDQPLDAFAKAQAVIDFTAPAATIEFSKLAAQARAVHVIGTTGMTDDEIAQLAPSARHAVIVRAGNMSLGVNLLVQLTKKVAAALDEDFDIEVIEAHHHHKVDAPSGTALMLGEAAAEGRGVALADVADRGRDGITGARKRGDIGFTAIRGGDIVGEHDVLFAAAGERIVLRHLATDRAIFARGALKAALWGQDKAPGEYDMVDVLGLRADTNKGGVRARLDYEAYIFDGKSDPNHTTGWNFVDGWPISGSEKVVPTTLTEEQKRKFHLAKIVTDAESFRPNNPYPDILTYNGDSDLYSQLVVDIIEEFEPGVHDLFQLIMIGEETGEEIRRDYYYQYLTNFCECVDEARTVFDRETEHRPKRPKASHKPKVTLFADAIKGKHLWRDSRFPNARFCSGAFKRRLEEEEIGGYRFYPCLVV